MRDYLGQLALRVQQPEFALQPRPVSRFESPRHAIFAAPELPARREADERGSQSAVFMPAETGAGKPIQPADSRDLKESGSMDSLSEARPEKKSHKSHPGQSMAEPPIVTPAISTEVTHQPLPEVGHPALSRRPTEQSKPIARSTVAQVQPLVRVENPVGKWTSPLSARAIYHAEMGVDSEPPETEPLFGRKADIMPKSGFDPIPGREIFKPLAEPTAPQFVAERVADVPTIQVTIGRVEIRATVASTPTRKTSTQSPVMSLDEYLKQRNGGRG